MPHFLFIAITALVFIGCTEGTKTFSEGQISIISKPSTIAT